MPSPLTRATKPDRGKGPNHVVESFVSLLPTIRDYFKYFPGGAFSGLTNTYQPDVTFLAAWQSGLLLLAYGVLFAALGTSLAVRRDIT